MVSSEKWLVKKQNSRIALMLISNGFQFSVKFKSSQVLVVSTIFVFFFCCEKPFDNNLITNRVREKRKKMFTQVHCIPYNLHFWT